jgi:3-phenylpropionate/trans-cinnamate dioxygenase ferredoxin reductase component
LLRPELATPFAPTPYVWSDQYGLKFQLLGRPAPDDEVVVVWGSFEERRFLVLYAQDGAVSAGLALDAPRLLRPLRDLVTARAPLTVAVSRLREHAEGHQETSAA